MTIVYYLLFLTSIIFLPLAAKAQLTELGQLATTSTTSSSQVAAAKVNFSALGGKMIFYLIFWCLILLLAVILLRFLAKHLKQIKFFSLGQSLGKLASFFWSRFPGLSKLIFIILIMVTIFLAGLASGYFCLKKPTVVPAVSLPNLTVSFKEDQICLAFLDEIYKKIEDIYWNSFSQTDLANIFKAGAEQLTGTQHSLASSTQEGLNIIYGQILKEYNQAQKKEFCVKLASLVLQTLAPTGRNVLYTQQSEQALKNEVQNINPGTDLYDNLGTTKEATPAEIEKAYQQKTEQLKTQETEGAKKELAKLNYAYEVLSDEKKKSKYDTFGTEPTVFSKIFSPNILHLYIKRFSPTTFEEMIEAFRKAVQEKALDTLILDLRGNIGGAIDLLPFILGPFIGQDQYAYEFFHQGERQPFKTKIGWESSMVRYKRVVVLVDSMTQSTGEVMAATLKKYNVGLVLGATTRGWGTVEKIYPLEAQLDPKEKYSMLLVSHLTLGDDNQPIEGRGVEPVINLASPDWREQFFQYHRDTELAETVWEIWKTAVLSAN